MRQKMLFTACLPALTLGACATTSFAPPNVRLNYESVMDGEGFRCGPRRQGEKIGHDVDGGRKLIDNFVLAYRCAAHEAANGRQYFEVPSFLALTGAAAATAFGAGPNVAIAATAGSGILNGASAYYDPRMKADVYDSALDALLCIKTEAVGIDALTVSKITAARGEQGKELRTKMHAFADAEPDPEVTVSANKQYFDLVAASLLSVERVASQRLSVAGKPFDAAGVIAQLKDFEAEEEAAETDEGGAAATEAEALMSDPTGKRFLGLTVGQKGAEKRQITETIIKLNALKPKLEKCVTRAKV
jgi:hypothetical protein